jgi:hypothetical protein
VVLTCGVSYLINVSRLNGKPNLGGIVEILVARKVDVVSVSDPINGVVVGDIEFLEGTGFIRWMATQESAGIRSTSRSSREGISKANRLPFRLPLDVYSVRNMLEKAEEDEFIVLFRYPNGKQKIFGNREQPVRFSFDHNSGEGYADGNFNNCEFFYDGPQNIFFYEGSITTAEPGTGTSRVEWADSTLIALLSPSDVLVLSSDFEHTFTLIPGPGGITLPAIVKWDDDVVIASLQPGDILRAETDFTDDLEIIEPV